MKKTIIILGVALVALGTQSFTPNVTSSAKMEVLAVNSPLCSAIVKGDIEAVKKFIQYGSDVNETSNGMTALMLAARYNQVEIVKLLLKNGAEKEVKDEKGFTALKYAELSNAVGSVALLKE